MDQKVKHHETRDLDVDLLNYLAWQHENKNDRAKGLKMVLGDGFIDYVFFWHPYLLGEDD